MMKRDTPKSAKYKNLEVYRENKPRFEYSIWNSQNQLAKSQNVYVEPAQGAPARHLLDCQSPEFSTLLVPRSGRSDTAWTLCKPIFRSIKEPRVVR